jgi:SEC-C motif-containing protein
LIKIYFKQKLMTDTQESDNRLCFCGSGLPFRDCCQPIIQGQRAAASAEALMRSRYSAYVVADSDYLLASWHADTRPRALQLEGQGISWLGLEVLDRRAGQPGDKTGRVSFIARYQQQGKPGAVQEDSRFVFEDGRWWYVDGNPINEGKPGRNDPCPCGSGRKYKKCCG